MGALARCLEPDGGRALVLAAAIERREFLARNAAISCLPVGYCVFIDVSFIG